MTERSSTRGRLTALAAFDVGRAHRALLRAIPRRRPAPGDVDPVAYLSSPVPVLGARVPELGALVRALDRRDPPPRPVDRRRLAARLWRARTFEERVLAVMVLQRTRQYRDAATWRMVRAWPDHATGWALSDTVSMGLLAPAVFESRDRYREVASWVGSRNVWRRRACLYAMGRLVRGGDLDRPFRVIDRLAADPEPWVQRAVGTWLRECWKQDRPRTERYLRAQRARVSRLALNVALERAPAATRAKLRALATRADGRRRNRPAG